MTLKTALMRRVRLWVVLIGVVYCLALFSCSSPRYTRVDLQDLLSVDCPTELQYNPDPQSLGPPEFDFSQTVPFTIKIRVFPENQSYSDAINYFNNDDSSFAKGRLVDKGKTLSVFKWQQTFKVNDEYELRQNILIVRDLSNLRSGIVWGKTTNITGLATDNLTRYCTQIARSMVASPAWKSDGRGGIP
jgi:hypothetical protein